MPPNITSVSGERLCEALTVLRRGGDAVLDVAQSVLVLRDIAPAVPRCVVMLPKQITDAAVAQHRLTNADVPGDALVVPNVGARRVLFEHLTRELAAVAHHERVPRNNVATTSNAAATARLASDRVDTLKAWETVYLGRQWGLLQPQLTAALAALPVNVLSALHTEFKTVVVTHRALSVALKQLVMHTHDQQLFKRLAAGDVAWDFRPAVAMLTSAAADTDDDLREPRVWPLGTSQMLLMQLAIVWQRLPLGTAERRAFLEHPAHIACVSPVIHCVQALCPWVLDATRSLMTVRRVTGNGHCAGGRITVHVTCDPRAATWRAEATCEGEDAIVRVSVEALRYSIEVIVFAFPAGTDMPAQRAAVLSNCATMPVREVRTLAASRDALRVRVASACVTQDARLAENVTRVDDHA